MSDVQFVFLCRVQSEISDYYEPEEEVGLTVAMTSSELF